VLEQSLGWARLKDLQEAAGLARKNGDNQWVGQNDQPSFVAQTQEATGLARKNGGDRKSEGQNDHLNQSSFVAQTQGNFLWSTVKTSMAVGLATFRSVDRFVAQLPR